MIEQLKIFNEDRVEKLLKKNNVFDERRDSYVQLEEMIINKMFKEMMAKKASRKKMMKMMKEMK
jgi:hypothetical protein